MTTCAVAVGDTGTTVMFSPREAPVYGGTVLEIILPLQGPKCEEDAGLLTTSPDDELFMVLQGHSQYHFVTVHHSHSSSWLAPLPGHACAEKVSLSVVRHIAHEDCELLAEGEFFYQYDSAYYLAQFLINSVNNFHALDDLELIKSDHFDLANEILSTLDERLSSALRHIPFPDGWHLLGSESEQEVDEGYCRETLLHFTGRLGLHKTALFLLSKSGAEEALSTLNRDGLLPCGVATHSDFHDIAELFSGYNTSGMITEVTEDLDTDIGVIRNHGSYGTSLTVSANVNQKRTKGEYIETLRDMDAVMRRGRSPALRRQYQTEWPSVMPQEQLCQHQQPLLDQPDPPYSQQVAETLERLYEKQRAHWLNVSPLLGDGTLQCAETTTRCDHSHGEDKSEDRDSPSQLSLLHSSMNFPSQVTEKATQQYGILEGSLQGVHGINAGLLKFKDESAKLRQKEIQAVRRLHLARFSTSCPTLDAHRKAGFLSPIHEGDQHRSMLDLAEEHGIGEKASWTSDHNQDTDRWNHDGSSYPGDDETMDGAVRICVNGVTLESSSDFSSATSNGEVDGVIRRRRSGRANMSRDEEMNRRRSWCPDSLVHFNGNTGVPLLNTSMKAMSGKSMSLSRLDCDEGSDEEFQDMRASPVDGHQVQFETHDHHNRVQEDGVKAVMCTEFHSDDDKSTVRSGGSCSRGDMSISDGVPQAAQSLTDLSHTPDNRKVVHGEIKPRTSSMSGSQDLQGYSGWGTMGVIHSNMTKSLSTPSIPAATQAADGHKEKRDGHREGKQPSDPSQVIVPNLIEDNDARFCRQEEIEEEEEDSVSADKKEISWKDFLNEELGAGDNDEKSRIAGRVKEEKKRKPSVFSFTRFQSSYRTRKQKDKEAKPKLSHHFVAVSFSNATQCHVCHKPMANKPALRCENCLINVHENNCKDQVAACEKNASMKVLQREGSAPAAVIYDKQVAAVQGTGLRPSNSFKLKDNRSSSAPIKSQTSSAMAYPGHRHSLPAGSKAINEMDETDGPLHGQDHSNMTETISESLESLDTVGTAEITVLEEEPDLMLGVDEPEAWNVTVDRKTLKKMNAKDIKRQDTIWELVQTEKHYVKRLKIMQKLFRDPMQHELNLPEEQVERMFPHLDHLVVIHSTFLRNLLALQNINPDRSVDEIGDLLVEQFSDSSAQKMKSAYGMFCSKHTEAIQLYKDIAKADRKFQNFCRKISNLGVCEKRELPDFILGVTVRLSKYPILIEAILKSTKDKKDREQVSKALVCSKAVVHNVDQQVALYEKLMEVYRSLDSRTTVYRSKKFKRQDLIAHGRHLLHTGVIGWKNARGRVVDAHTLVLTDVMVFLQKNEQKYTFLMQDNKTCVVPLYKLLVREKGDERDSHGIYVINQNRTEPEMYELVCRTRDERDQWMRILQEAIKNCPEEEEVQRPEVVMEEECRKQEEKSRKIKEIINQLHHKDDVIRECCDEKNRLMMELMEVSTAQEDIHLHSSSHQYLSSSTSVEVVQAAIQEASHLTTILQGSGIPLSRSVSSVGEHVSTSYVNMPVPKRAETFAGFDSSFGTPQPGSVVRKRFTQQFGDEDGRSPSEPSFQDTICEDSAYSDDRRPGLSPQSLPLSTSSSSLPHSSPSMWDQQSAGEREVIAMELSSKHGSLGELSPSSVSSLVKPPTSPASTEQMMSIVQLVCYLHNLMNLTAKQCTTVESLRAELADAKEEISKLSSDLHGRKNINRHNQLEELRNLQENISRERQEWERTKERELVAIRQEKAQLEAKRIHLEKQENELRAKKEDLHRERETLQKQIDMMCEQGLLMPSTLMDSGHVVHTIDLDAVPASNSQDASAVERRVPGHRRSASADFFQTQSVPGAPFDLDIASDQDSRGMPRHPRHSVSAIHSFAGPGVKQTIPAHLMSTRNEQRVGGANMQQLPMKLSLSSSSVGSGTAGSGNIQRPSSHHMHPRASSMGSLGGRPGGLSPAPSQPSPSQMQGMIIRNQNSHSRSTPSNLALVMKLAEPSPSSKSRSASQSQSQVSGLANHPAGGNSAPGGPGSAPADSGSDKVIYF